MLKIYIARHGQDKDNANGILNGRRDMPLTRNGIEQAQYLADEIKQAGISFDHIYTSPLVRAHKTAEIVTENTGSQSPEVMEELIERDFGIMTGLEKERIEELCAPDVMRTETITYFLSPEGAETFPDLIKRAKKLLNAIQTKHTDGNVLLVTHGDIGEMIYAAYYGLEWKDILTAFHFGNSDLLLLSKDSDPNDAHLFQATQYNF